MGGALLDKEVRQRYFFFFLSEKAGERARAPAIHVHN
jgi:hypothetical protein